MLYIHQYPDWTKFRYDSRKVMNALGRVRFAEGRLTGISSILGDNDIEDEIIAQDIIATYAIDGENLTREALTQSSFQDGLTLIDAYHKLIKTQTSPNYTFEEENLFKWRIPLDKNHTPDYRKGEGVIKDASGNTIFVGPGPDRVPQEMTNFITWFNISQMDNVIKAAIAHFWFVTIRPFYDANGIIARAITNLLLSRANGSGHALYAINEQILQDKEEYFKILANAQAGNGDLTEWILWFLKTLLHAVQKSEEAVSAKITSIKFKSKKNAEGLTPRAQRIVDAVLSGALPQIFNVKEVAALTGTSHDSALRDIQKMIELNLVAPSKKGGRSTRYSLIL